jgi:hypothetical protein
LIWLFTKKTTFRLHSGFSSPPPTGQRQALIFEATLRVEVAKANAATHRPTNGIASLTNPGRFDERYYFRFVEEHNPGIDLMAGNFSVVGPAEDRPWAYSESVSNSFYFAEFSRCNPISRADRLSR